MKVIVCADSHGAFAAAERLLEQNREAAAVIFLGMSCALPYPV